MKQYIQSLSLQKFAFASAILLGLGIAATYAIPALATSFGNDVVVTGTLTTGGSVGIGTPNPGAFLEIQGGGGSGTYGSLLNIVSNTTVGPAIFLGGNASYNGGSWRIIGGGSGNLGGTIKDSFAIFDQGAGAVRMVINSSGSVGIGTPIPTAKLDINGDKIRIQSAKTPSSSSEACNQGDIAWDSNFVYTCIAANTWKRAALTSW